MSFAVSARSVIRPTTSFRTGKNVRTSFAKSVAPKPSFKRSVSISAVMGDKWYPGAVSPDYLDGSMAGDYGFDPLRLGANEKSLPWYREAELMNGRWAMMATLGIVATEQLGLPKWYEAGALDYGFDTTSLIGVEVVVMGFLEALRIDGYNKTGETGFLSSYPFDPLGLAKDATAKKSLMEKEVKNARLAMLAFLGFTSQYAVQGMGPIECLNKHLEDPMANNIFTSSVGPEVTVAVAVASCLPMIIQAEKTLSDDDEKFRPIPW
mmetsp:Transcript_41580/g.50433  ORF Transcript_41580/g.50433 Transcript_41580/m.50433 type:complete len:265 (+) Transcript_41580:64-858(+)